MILDTAITIQEHRLASLLAEGVRQARERNRPVLVSTVLRAAQYDPLVFFDHGARLADERVFWSSPSGDMAMAGVDRAWAVSASRRLVS